MTLRHITKQILKFRPTVSFVLAGCFDAGDTEGGEMVVLAATLLVFFGNAAKGTE
jgi:hypothetical protein